MYMRREISQFRWLRLLSNLNDRSRVHLRVIAGHVTFVVLFSSPMLAIDENKPILFLAPCT